MNHFTELGINPTEDTSQIKKAYLKKAQQYHPDNQSTGDEEKFKRIHHAYKMLTDPSYKDEQRKTNNGPMNLDITVQLILSFDQAFFGDLVFVTTNPVMMGDIELIPTNFKADIDIQIFALKIPPGTITGSTHTLTRRGLYQGDRVGNMIIQYQVVPHPKFTVALPNVLSIEAIPLEVMLTGGEVDIPTMWGIKPLILSPGTQPGQRYKIPNCGIERVGDHIVSIIPKYPSEDDLKNNKTWRKLNIRWG